MFWYLSDSIVRDAMVEIMVGAMAPRQQQQQLGHEPKKDWGFLGNGGSTDGGGGGGGGGGGETNSVVGQRVGGSPSGLDEKEKGWGGSAAWFDHGDTIRTTGKCVLWCAIALGALVRGAPVDYVRRSM